MAVTVGKIRSFEELDIFTTTGTVVGQQGRTSTHHSTETTTQGGTAYIAGRSTTTVSSSSTHHQRLFARKDDGEEFDVEFPDVNFGVREGHRVSVICAGPKSTGRGHPMALVNHATGNYQMFNARVSWVLDNRIKLFALAWGALLVVLLMTTRGKLGGVSMLLLLIGGGVVAWEAFRWLTLYRKVRLEVESIAQSRLRNEKGQARAL